MKRIDCLILLFMGISMSLCAQTFSPYPTSVLEYRPAPGQFINENYPQYEDGDTEVGMNKKALECLQTKDGLVSLGAYGGSITLAFDHPIVNSGGEYDFKIYGNAHSNSFEPGIVMVSADVNRNGLADDPWYELKGSEYDACTHGYTITYFRPDPLNGDVVWEDNLGETGVVKRNAYHQQASYYPLWQTAEELTFQGTRFPESRLGEPGQWGYADNAPNNTDFGKFKIDWAVDAKGRPIHLATIDFIKVYTAVNVDNGALGELSTELGYPGVEDLHPAMAYALDNNTLDPNKDYHILDLSALLTTPGTTWEKTLTYEPTLDPDESGINEHSFEASPYQFHHTVTWSGAAWEGFTYSNIVDRYTTGYDNQFASITGGGVDGAGTTYLTGYYSAYSTVNKQYIAFANDEDYQIAGAYITNSTLNYYSMSEGDGYAKKFGGEDGTDPDWFKITFTGEDGNGNTTADIDFYLADFRSDNSSEDYIVDSWKWVDLSALGKVSKVYYTLSGSDMGEYGLNTPTFFCLDKIAVEKHQNPNANLAWIKIDGVELEDFTPDRVKYIVNLSPEATALPIVSAEAVNPADEITITQATDIPGEATIIVQPEEGLSKIYTVSFRYTVDISGGERFSAQVYPNPTTNVLHLTGFSGTCHVQVFSLKGELMMSRMSVESVIHTEDWTPGIYIIRLSADGHSNTFKIIKQ